ncbi:MAG: hypothetical protein AB1515_10615 [Nitrospirota bacterium]
MAKKSEAQKLISKVAPKKVLEQNAKALKYYGYYKKTSDLIERVDTALGRKPTFRANTGSTLNFEMNWDGISSTTAQKI